MNTETHPVTFESWNAGAILKFTFSGHDKDAVQAAAARYKENYHPLGYGTSMMETREHDGIFTIYGHRAHSCD